MERKEKSEFKDKDLKLEAAPLENNDFKLKQPEKKEDAFNTNLIFVSEIVQKSAEISAALDDLDKYPTKPQQASKPSAA